MPVKRKIRQLDSKGNVIATFDSAPRAAKKTDVPLSTIYAVAKGRIKKPKGFRWEFVEPKTVKSSDKLSDKSSKRSEAQKFYCQGCGKKGSLKRKFLVCEDCLRRLTVEKEGGKLPDVVYIPVKRPVLASVVEKALKDLVEKEKES